MNIPIKIGIRGKYTIVVKNAAGNIKESLEFDNLITNHGLDICLTGGSISTFSKYVSVGTGTNTPITSDINLQSPIARLSGDSTKEFDGTSPTYAVSARRTYNFGGGAVVGNITEIGVGDNTSGTYGITTCSRALILDSFGNPTTLTLTADDYLTVIYTLYIVPDLNDHVFTIGDYTLTLRACSAGSAGAWHAGYNVAGSGGGVLYTGDMGDVTGSPSGTSLSSTSTTLSTYVNGSFTRSMTATWTPTSGAIVAQSIKFIVTGCYHQARISPAINKTTSHSVSVTIQITLSRV